MAAERSVLYPDEPVFDEGEDGRPDHRRERRESSSTINSSRRQSYYDSQRINRRSRPPSGASQATQGTSKSKGKRVSYQKPAEFGNVDESAVPRPVQQDDNERPHLEDERGRQQHPGGLGLHPVPNFSQPYAMRRRPSGSNSRNQNISEVEALPPVPKTERFSAATTQGQNTQSRPYTQDAERADLSDSSNDRPYSSRYPRDYMPASSAVPRWLTEIYTISYLIFFAIFGTLARLGVQWITFYPGAPITTPVIWANVGGSFIMGFLSEDQGLFRDKSRDEAGQEDKHADLETINKAELLKRKKTIPLYIGLATGFCGSFTSFSSFARDFFLAMSNNLLSPVSHPYPAAAGAVVPSSYVGRNGGYSFEAILAVIFSTLALSLGALLVGAHVAVFLEGYTPSLPVNFVRRILDPLMIFLGWGCWLGAIFMSIWPPDRPGGPSSRGSWANESWRGEVLFALVFAPLGCLLRFYASLKLNGLVASFPLGTFAVNMLGTAIEGMSYDIQHVGVGAHGMNGGGRIGCQILQGVMDGFCGCLTTVSTWVSEINGLQRKHGYLYAFTTVVGGLCLMTIIMGSVQWSHGFSEPVCNTGYSSKVHA
ncbi:hypothetical protein M409DRAFT_28568 [Zasmidium cellare ATCC 36951]|uniref:Uncharacterized protein n=1 Tax=Zasmidium cellare ATCC 36951 TaxID=1080233 RepID=A0A6A6C518_ZASCE|nr:uncharacterized protein M409DRAFT_28568 [Zasmidium cellare ATCC 36951]KAF2160962.1 hypothetical protein M409DRAFT_28568 [Zasmidium cellare ATCC 36951]